jgi:hypothetical protein
LLAISARSRVGQFEAVLAADFLHAIGMLHPPTFEQPVDNRVADLKLAQRVEIELVDRAAGGEHEDRVGCSHAWCHSDGLRPGHL